jgi:hypothetical protein
MFEVCSGAELASPGLSAIRVRGARLRNRQAGGRGLEPGRRRAAGASNRSAAGGLEPLESVECKYRSIARLNGIERAAG